MGVLEYQSLRRHLSSTAAIGILFIPITIAPYVAAAAVWGLSAWAVLQSKRGLFRGSTVLLALAWTVTIVLPAAIPYELVRGYRLQCAVRDALEMKSRDLEAAFEHHSLNRNRFFLGTIAQNAGASPDLLDRIASIPDAALFRKMWSRWDVMGENRRGIAVMRLVILNPNVRSDTLEKLASSPHANESVLSNLLSNHKTPVHVLVRYKDTTCLVMKWGLAENPNTPVEVLERLAKDRDRHTADRARRTLGR